MNIVLFGPPGVGKGTQGVRLAERFSIVHLAMGDLLRKAVKDKSELGVQARSYMDAGKLVPDDVVIGMIEERIISKDVSNGFLLDGFPRNVAQATALNAMLLKHELNIDHVIFMEAEETCLIERLSGRLICKGCGFGFHRQYSPPEKDGCCDRCGSELYQRDDDRKDVIEKRLKVYLKETQPLLDFYSDLDVFSKVDATKSMGEVFHTLEKSVQG
ncbi:MAG: adenylate kinase [Mariprofundaceae bacterium]|nr:adenylate kinase [Mariprofundaceae bacterium]